MLDAATRTESRASAEKATFFSPDIFLRHLHYGVGVPSAYQADFWGEKQKIYNNNI